MAPRKLIVIVALAMQAGLAAGASVDDARRAIRLRNYDAAAVILKEWSAAGDAEAQYQLAGLYRAGLGVPRDAAHAEELLRDAAASGHAKAREALEVRWQPAPAPEERPDEQLRRAAQRGDVVTIRALLDHGIDVNGRADNGRTALIDAAGTGQAEAIRTLLSAGAAVDARDANGETALLRAVRDRHDGAVTALLDAGASPDLPDQFGNTPLIVAAGNGQRDAVAALLAAGADITAQDEREWTALSAARLRGHDGIASLLRGAGATDPWERRMAPPEKKADWSQASGQALPGWSNLTTAAWRGDADGVRSLLRRGDVNWIDADGRTALSHAAERGHLAVISALLGAGADADARAKNGYTAIVWAARRGHAAVVEALLAAGADPNVTSAGDETVLMHAVAGLSLIHI